jgi:DNA uptake protein ComE-like DNA-binding protein
MNWKDFFFFSKGEKNGILVLICLIAIVLAMNRGLPYCFRKESADVSVYQGEIKEFKESMERKEGQLKYSSVGVQGELFRFDPNKLDSTGFIRLGIPSYLVINILKYRSKGGVFRKPENFCKIYGMKEALYAELSSYIFIEKELKANGLFSEDRKSSKVATEKKEKYSVSKIEVIELNSSDTTQLKKLKGIGVVYADRIIKYRNYLGGFYQAEQLKEVFGVSEELFLSLEPQLAVDVSQVKKIRLNHGDLNYWLRHPYLKKEQLSALILFRQKKRTIDSFEALKELTEFSNEDWERLIPYLSLE